MKRTAVLFAIAATLGLVALVAAVLPRLELKRPTDQGQVVPPPVQNPPVVVVEPVQPPPPVEVVPPPPQPQTAGDVLKLTGALSDPYIALGGQAEVYLKADIEAIRRSSAQRAPVNLALVLDRSGSMAGDKIEHCRRAAQHLVTQLDDRDRFARVTFGSDTTVLISSTLATPAAKERMQAAIDGILDMGGTNISGALEAGLAEVVAYKSQYPVSRIVLLSDGQANEGVTDPNGLAQIARKFSSQRVTLSSIGVGLDFNELVLESLSEYGGGSYHFLASTEQLQKIFSDELKQAVATVAISPSLSITPLNGALVAEVYGYKAESLNGVTSVRLPDFSSGEHRKVVIRMLVPASAAGTVPVARVGLGYLDVTRNRAQGYAQVSIDAAVTTDPSVVAKNRNAEVASEAARVNALQTMRKASTSFSAGRADEAKRYLATAKTQLKKAQAEFGPSDDYREAMEEASVFEGALSAPENNEVRSQAAKRLHSFSRSMRE